MKSKSSLTNVFLLVLFLSQFVYAQENNQWKTLSCTGEPVARHEATFLGINDHFYLLGGRRIQPVSIYDVESNTWSQGAKPPIELHHFQGFSYDGDVYVAGAFTGEFPYEKPVKDIYKYDVETDAWSIAFGMPEGRERGAGGSVIFKDKLYVVGGLINGHWDGHVTWFDVYDFATKQWSELPDIPRYRDHFNAVIVNDKMYLVAGRISSGKTEEFFELTENKIDVFDFRTAEWTTLETTLPTGRAGNAAIAIDDELIIAGGESSAQVKAHNEVEALNVLTGEWTDYPSLINGRHGTQLIYYKGSLYIASGCGNRGGNPELTSLEKY
ncbi:Kelch repeat-containing protein [Lutimonas sp.]|uniref:Kelch repeat-containing protein n=1 Tax=Lutimonas sp. TaxID=1872403 RepID=UPI003D9B26AF